MTHRPAVPIAPTASVPVELIATSRKPVTEPDVTAVGSSPTTRGVATSPRSTTHRRARPSGAVPVTAARPPPTAKLLPAKGTLEAARTSGALGTDTSAIERPKGSEATNAVPLPAVTSITEPMPGTKPTSSGSNVPPGVAVTTGVGVRVAVGVTVAVDTGVAVAAMVGVVVFVRVTVGVVVRVDVAVVVGVVVADVASVVTLATFEYADESRRRPIARTR
jgi:hypothetical protein